MGVACAGGRRRRAGAAAARVLVGRGAGVAKLSGRHQHFGEK